MSSQKGPTINTKNPIENPMQNYTSIVILNEKVLQQKESVNTLAAWYILRTYIRDYRNKYSFNQKDAVRVLSSYLGISNSQVYDILKDGNGIYWDINDKVLYIKSIIKVLTYFNILPEPSLICRIQTPSYPLEYLQGKVKERRAHFFKSTTCKNEAIPEKEGLTFDKEINKTIHIKHSNDVKHNKASSKPISRETIKKRTGVQRHTQRMYESLSRERGDTVWVHYNWALILPLNQQETKHIKTGTSLLNKDEVKSLWSKVYTSTNGEALGYSYQCRTFDKVQGIYRQLSNSYSDNSSYVKNPLLVKYFGHSAQTKRSTLKKRLAAILDTPQETESFKEQAFSIENILFAEDSVHQYVSILPRNNKERKDKEILVESVSSKNKEWYELESIQKSHKHYKRNLIWKEKNIKTKPNTLPYKEGVLKNEK